MKHFTPAILVCLVGLVMVLYAGVGLATSPGTTKDPPRRLMPERVLIDRPMVSVTLNSRVIVGELRARGGAAG